MGFKERRCNLFDDHGRPRRQKNGMKGCQRDASDCRYVHPHERDWKTAKPSYPPRPEFVIDSDSDFYYILVHSDRTMDDRDREIQKERDQSRERPREREREKEKERRRDSKQSSSFHSESPLYRKDSTHGSPRPSSSRRSTFDSTMADGGATKRPRSPDLSASSDHLEMLLKDNRQKAKGKERSDLPNVMSPTVSDISYSRHLSAVPPEPSKPPPSQPPPPPPPSVPEVPKLPSFVSDRGATGLGEGTSKGLKDLSMDEQRQAWHERIDLMFTSIAARRDHTKLETELSHIHRLSHSSLTTNMSETDRTRIDTQKRMLESQLAAKRKEVNDVIQKLIRSEFWPILRTPHISELEKTLEESKKYVLEVKSVLDDLKSSCAALLKTAASESTEEANRPTKRRKLDTETDTPGKSATDTVEINYEDATKELEGFRDKLTELTGHLGDLENDITQRNAIVSDEVELQINNWLEEEGALYPPIEEPAEVSPAEIEAVVNAKNQELVRAVMVAGEEIGVLAMEVAELITKVDALEARCRALEVENEELKSKIIQNALQHAKDQDTLVRREKEVEAIAAALQAYITQMPTSQPTGDLPSPEYIIQSLDTQLDSLFRQKFFPALVNFQREVSSKVQESHDRTMSTVSPKIMLLVKMVNLITARLGQPDMDARDTT